MIMEFENNNITSSMFDDFVEGIYRFKIKTIEDRIEWLDNFEDIEQKENQIMQLQNELRKFKLILKSGKPISITGRIGFYDNE